MLVPTVDRERVDFARLWEKISYIYTKLRVPTVGPSFY